MVTLTIPRQFYPDYVKGFRDVLSAALYCATEANRIPPGSTVEFDGNVMSAAKFPHYAEYLHEQQIADAFGE